MHTVKKVLLASPRGFCAGVARAVKAVEDTLDLFDSPVYVKHEIVHNKHVVSRIEAKGAVTVENLVDIPDESVVVFSAHGSTPKEFREAKARGMTLIDATCPLVTKVHLEVIRFLKEGYSIVYIGHKGHPEGIGVMAEAQGKTIPIVENLQDVAALQIDNPEKLVYLTQTTLSLDDTRKIIEALQKKYPQIIAPPLEDICYATTNRQTAVTELARVVEVVLVIGSVNSSNSRRLMETAKREGAEAYLLDDVRDLDPKWLEGKETVGITAGASAPEDRVQELVEFFRRDGAMIESYVAKSENMQFAEPVELMKLKRERS